MSGWAIKTGQLHICITSTPMCVFTVHKHDFDVHTAFYPHVASCPPRVPSLPLNTMVLTTLTTTLPPGTTITIGCVDGYYTDREEILTCGSDGQWRGNITQCRGMDLRDYASLYKHVHTIATNTSHTIETCTASSLTAISDDIAYTVPTEIRPGTVVGTHCGEGYQVAINAVCQDDRTWRVQEQCVQSEFGNENGNWNRNGRLCTLKAKE